MTIDFENINSIPKLIKDFLGKKLDGFQNKIFDLENFKIQIADKQKSFSDEKRKVLYNTIFSQNQESQLSPKQLEFLFSLKESNTFTITTGHQLNLFTGPVFFIYKILQTIKTAEFLKSNFPDHHFVPIFWMATEDHDFEEIDHFKTREHYYEIKGNSGGDVGNIKIDDQYFIQEFEKEFKDHLYGTELILWIKNAYKKGNSHTQAIRYLVNQLFADYGLLTIDGNSTELKSQVKDIFKKELLSNQLFETTKTQREFLEKEYHKVQVNPREINLFYLSETRNRIEKINYEFQILDTNLKFTQEEILNELEKHPEKFSPNAVLRPAYQESVLPNLAYVGGNAEIMYWIELKDHFKSIDLPFPILIPRNSMLFLAEKTFKKIENSGLEIENFFENFAEVLNQKILENNDIKLLLTEKELQLIGSFSELKNKASETEKTFLNLVEAEETRQLKSFKRMQKRLLKAEKTKQSERFDQMQGLFLKVHPGGNWQERVFNFSVFYADLGKQWIDESYQKMNVQKSELIISPI
ncbi:bacillithiol biosynthesis cysteine-adding enzyme BshC [Epilithonimonas ginsengisoli]|uniref:Putative cysteine ligase BshC n=1 Tax=Epilithonimonas ginsengisoli TaxID=1245592 RepID=A0ABU4JJC1_9FLAO|nr:MULTISPECIES: bacillithiol biosynthesis cysteine-adding enzyme BshC [Chryseobacterium group]MBV6880902.1 bacillithiol biosynthesis cysteine-adding enzyme BshC [Epilithonimonas sp. FP105]MDW8549792.1 bacillithiol biosynthesis cysteine-adding enzyme BshC [Epilithonimonas ginsengisoli]OAH66552.1 bacillithiol biosynthesis cysteine-adding enzyme BshC [Chryseobacterium sp. FP211-J200]